MFNKNEKIAYNKGYRVSKSGKCLNPNGEEISRNNNGKDYYVFSLRNNGKILKIGIHRLQAYQKFGDSIYNKGMQVRHLNGNSLDNSICNIEIGTGSQNMMDRSSEDRLKHAILASSHIVKFDHSRVKAFYNKCKSYKKTMIEFDIKSKSTLHNIVTK